MEIAKNLFNCTALCLQSLASGVREALALRRPFDAVRGSRTIRLCMLKCLLLNGLLFLGSIALFEFALKPAVVSLSRLVFGETDRLLSEQSQRWLGSLLALIYYVSHRNRFFLLMQFVVIHIFFCLFHEKKIVRYFGYSPSTFWVTYSMQVGTRKSHDDTLNCVRPPPLPPPPPPLAPTSRPLKNHRRWRRQQRWTKMMAPGLCFF